MHSHGIFLVHGISGCGKSHLLRLLETTFPNVTVHVKDSSRDPRALDHDINQVPKEHFIDQAHEYVAIYERYDRLYGIRRDQWDKAYQERQLHFVIVTDINTIRLLKAQYNVKAIHIHADPRDLKKVLRQRKAGLTREELERQEGVKLEERLRRMDRLIQEYVNNITIFDYCVINYLYPLEDQPAAKHQLEQIIRDHLHSAASYLVK